MQRLEVSCAVRLIYTSLSAKGLSYLTKFPQIHGPSSVNIFFLVGNDVKGTVASYLAIQRR